MPNNADDFARELAKQIQQVEAAGSELHRKMGLDLLRVLIDKTPIGNRELWKINKGRSKRKLLPKGYVGGHLRHNWQVTIDRTTDAELDGISRSAAATYRREEPKVLRAPFGSIIYIQNPVPYSIPVMERGTSTQAPSGTFRVTIQEIAVKYNAQVGG